MKRLVKWIENKLWHKPPAWTDEFYHDYCLEITAIIGGCFIGISLGTPEYALGTAGFGIGIWAGMLMMHRFGQNKEKGWSYR